MRNAISWLREARADLGVERSSRLPSRRARRPGRASRAIGALTPAGSLRNSTGSEPLRSLQPWCWLGRKPLPQKRADERLHVAEALRDQHDEGRQVRVGAAEAVADPRAERRPARLLVAGLEERDARLVVDRVGVHRVHEAQLVAMAPVCGISSLIQTPSSRLR
jgi:hypothetical protein